MSSEGTDELISHHGRIGDDQSGLSVSSRTRILRIYERISSVVLEEALKWKMSASFSHVSPASCGLLCNRNHHNIESSVVLHR